MSEKLSVLSLDKEDSFDFIKEKKIKPHYTAWKCPRCSKMLFDDGDSVFFLCQDGCQFTFFKNEIRGSVKFKEDYISPEVDWDKEDKLLLETYEWLKTKEEPHDDHTSLVKGEVCPTFVVPLLSSEFKKEWGGWLDG